MRDGRTTAISLETLIVMVLVSQSVSRATLIIDIFIVKDGIIFLGRRLSTGRGPNFCRKQILLSAAQRGSLLSSSALFSIQALALLISGSAQWKFFPIKNRPFFELDVGSSSVFFTKKGFFCRF